jgi:hypothetical protein
MLYPSTDTTFYLELSCNMNLRADRDGYKVGLFIDRKGIDDASFDSGLNWLGDFLGKNIVNFMGSGKMFAMGASPCQNYQRT